MNYLISDIYKEPESVPESIELTEEDKIQLKQFIEEKTNEAGGKIDYCELVKLCHQSAPESFRLKLTEGIIMQAIEEKRKEFEERIQLKNIEINE